MESVFDDYVSAFVEHAKSLVIGDPLDPKTDLGPMVSGQSLLISGLFVLMCFLMTYMAIIVPGGVICWAGLGCRIELHQPAGQPRLLLGRVDREHQLEIAEAGGCGAVLDRHVGVHLGRCM